MQPKNKSLQVQSLDKCRWKDALLIPLISPKPEALEPIFIGSSRGQKPKERTYLVYTIQEAGKQAGKAGKSRKEPIFIGLPGKPKT